MQTTVEIVIPIFALVLAGWGAARFGVLSQEGVRGLAAFVFWVALPAFLFRTMGRGIDWAAVDWGLALSYFGSSAIIYASSLALSRKVFGLRLGEAAVFAMSTAWSNMVLLGLPLIVAAFGERGVLPLMMLVALDSILMIPLSSILIEIGRGGRARGRALRATAVALAKNPVIVSTAAGVLWGAGGLGLPSPVERFAELLSGAAPACALFSLGATLASYRLAGKLSESCTIVAAKLIVHPLLVWTLANFVFRIDPLWAAVATVIAGTPVGANAFILAQSYGVYVQRATSATLISTGVAIITVAFLLACFAPPA
jgi:predicted permease